MNDNQHTILCVDDEANILHSIKRLLRKEGYRLLTASSGVEGLKILEENDVHLILSDQRMPQMSGTEFLAAVREKYPDVIRIILTGYTEVDSITES
ncbi:MAG: response regulator, partial [Desulfobacterales bacterium]|nr:response regulator [Desulfobacterales bacterium]